MTPLRRPAPNHHCRPRSAPVTQIAGDGHGDGDAGTITLFLVPIVLAVLAVAGLVYDGGAKLTAGRRADSLAQEAARAGAEQVSPPGSGTALRLDPGRAASAAQAYLAQAGESGTATVTGPGSISVTVTITRPTALLDLIGISSTTVTGHASAHIARGIVREDP